MILENLFRLERNSICTFQYASWNLTRVKLPMDSNFSSRHIFAKCDVHLRHSWSFRCTDGLLWQIIHNTFSQTYLSIEDWTKLKIIVLWGWFPRENRFYTLRATYFYQPSDVRSLSIDISLSYLTQMCFWKKNLQEIIHLSFQFFHLIT